MHSADSNGGLEYRPARESDLAGALLLLRACGLPTAGVLDQFGDQYEVAVSSSQAGSGRSAIVGLAGLEVHGKYGLLRSVAVADRWRGQGVASRLVESRVAAARSRGLRGLFVLTSTATPFFRNLGFAVVDRAGAPEEIRASSEYCSICPASAALLHLELRDGGSARVSPEGLRAEVRRRYGQAARRAFGQAARAGALCGPSCCPPRQVTGGQTESCCGGNDGSGAACCSPVTTDLYSIAETEGLPPAAVLASLGCGNPTALAELKPGETVLDLGSGGGIDVLLTARRVGPNGKAYGVDMTPDMLALARRNAAAAGVCNAEFLLGEIEHLPLPDESVDVIISNCVINLSADKRQVLNEAYRVLRPGGRFAVSDIVVRGTVPEHVRTDLALWVSCIAGALAESEFRALLADAGFSAIEIIPTRGFELREGQVVSVGLEGVSESGAGPAIVSAFIRAVKAGK